MRRLAIAGFLAASSLGVLPLGSPALARQDQRWTGPEQITVDFKGGTVAQYVELLKKSGKAVNIVASERASKQQLSALSLNQVNIGVAVYSIQAAAASGAGQWKIDQITPPMGGYPPGMLQPGGEAYSVDFFPFGRRGEDLVVESYSLVRIIKSEGHAEGMDAKVVLTAIETGLKLQNEGAEQPPDLKFHSDSGLLFVRGTNSDVRLVGSIVSRLLDDARSRTIAAEKRAREAALRANLVKDAKLEIELREMELAVAQQTREQVRKLADQGTVPSSELSRVELEFGKARISLERAKLALEKAQTVSTESADPAETEAPAATPPTPQPPPGLNPKSTKRPGVR